MNNVFILGGRGGRQLSVEQAKLYFIALDCVIGRALIKGRLSFGAVESHRPLPLLLGQMIFIKLAVMRNTDLHVDPAEAEKSPPPAA